MDRNDKVFLRYYNKIVMHKKVAHPNEIQHIIIYLRNFILFILLEGTKVINKLRSNEGVYYIYFRKDMDIYLTDISNKAMPTTHLGSNSEISVKTQPVIIITPLESF